VNLHPVTPVSFSLSRQQFVAYKDTLLLTNVLLRLCVRKWHKNARERTQTHTSTKHTHTQHPPTHARTHALSLTHSLTQSIYQPTNQSLSIYLSTHPFIASSGSSILIQFNCVTLF